MKIGLLHNLYGEFSRGGAETVVKMKMEELRIESHEVFLITTKPRRATISTETGNDSRNQKEKIYYINSEFYNLGRHSLFYHALWQLGQFLSFNKYRQIKKILRAEKPDLVITHNLLGLGWLVPLAIRKLNINHEHFLHDIQLLHPSGLMIWGQENKINSLAAKIYQQLIKSLFGSPEKIISPSAWLLNLHRQKKLFPDSQTEIRPFTWPPSTTVQSSKTGGLKNFLFIGQIERQKGVFLLIKAFKKLSGSNLKLIMAIRGGGRDLKAAKDLASSDKRIEFRGPLSYQETEKIKTTSDCLVVPSLCYENSPTVIYGARAAGLRVIAANLGGIPEIIGPTDKLFKPGDERDLEDKLRAETL